VILILDKSLEDSEVLKYIEERTSIWDTCRQLTNNELVSAIARQYGDLNRFCEKNDSIKALHQRLRQTIDEKHPIQNLTILPIVAAKIVSADVLARLDDKRFFPKDDWVEQLTWIQRTRLIETIRQRDSYKPVKVQRQKPETIELEPKTPATKVTRFFRNPFQTVKNE
jgi:hypothetical protein